MSDDYSRNDLEVRIAELEDQLKRQDTKIKVLGVALSLVSPFADPLDNFFNAPEFWEVVYEDPGACVNRCYKRYKAEVDACNGDEDCELAAVRDYLSCNESCGWGIPRFPL
jgi:hypothetical protein